MPFKLYEYSYLRKGDLNKGLYWKGESVEEHLRLTQYQTIVNTVINTLTKDGRILDAGCGLGRWLIYLSKLGYNIIGIDCEEEAVSAIYNYDKSIQAVTCDSEKTPFPNCSFDAILSFGVIEHNEDGPEKALREMYRLLKPGGTLLVTVPYLNLLRKLIYNPVVRIVGLTLILLDFKKKFTEYRYSKTEMIVFLKDIGYQITLSEPDDFSPPKNMGLYADWWRIMGNRRRKWELNLLGRCLHYFLRQFNVWFYCAGILFVAKKPSIPSNLLPQ